MLIHDVLAGANWQRSVSPKRKPPRPKPLSPLAKRGQRGQIHYGDAGGRSNDEIKAMLARYGPRPADREVAE